MQKKFLVLILFVLAALQAFSQEAFITVSGSSLCAGGSVTLTFHFTTGQAPYSAVYSVDINNDGSPEEFPSLSGIADGHTIQVSPTQLTAYKIEFAQDGNTTTPVFPVPETENHIITVISKPDGTIVGPSQPICAGTQAGLQFFFTAGTGPFDVVYTDGANQFQLNDIPHGHQVQVSPPAGATNYSYVSIADAHCVNNGPFGVAATVNVFALPSGTITGPSQPVCAGGQATLTFNFQQGAEPFSVVYTDGTNNHTLNNIVSGYQVQVSPAVNTSYTFVSITDSHCSRLSGFASPATVQVRAPSGTISGPSAVCAGGQAQLQFSLQGEAPFQVVYSNGAEQFTWTGTEHNPIIPVTVLQPVTYTLVSVQGGGCLKQVNMSHFIEVTTALQAVVTAPAAVCIGEDASIGVTITGGQAPFEVVYELNANITTASAKPSVFNITSALQKPLTVKLVSVTDAGGCQLKPENSSTTVFPINLNLLEASITSASDCNQADGSIRINTAGQPGAFQFQWSTGQQTQDLQAVRSGRYTLKVKHAAGCEATFSYTVDQKQANVVIDPRFLLTSTIFTGDTLHLIDLVLPAPDSVSWNFGNGISTSQPDTVFIYTTPGTYTIALVAYLDGCVNALTKTVEVKRSTGGRRRFGDDPAGLPFTYLEQSEEFPNPVQHELTVRLKVNRPDVVLVSLFSMQGDVVCSKEQFIESSDLIKIDMQGLPPGLYYILYNTGAFREVKKIVKL